MTRKEIIATLEAANITFDPKAKKADLEALLPQTEPKTEEIKKEENEMTATNSISSAEFIEAMVSMANQYNWTLHTPKKEDGIIAKEGRKRVLELYWSNTKEALGGFDMYIRDDLFPEIQELVKENKINSQLTVNPKWKFTNRLSFNRENTQKFLNILRNI